MRYDLQRLGALGFQDCAAALAIKVLGANVRPMGRGRDGGRDMLANGRVAWSASDRYAAEAWDGTTVFQVKHKATLGEPGKDAAWVWNQIRIELDEWSNPDTKRQRVPHYFVFVTNVPLTPTQGTGGFDTVTARVQKYVDDLNDSSHEDHLDGSAKEQARRERETRRDRMRNLRKWRIWDGYQIDGLLDAHEGVRRAFDGFLTAGDALADLSKLSTSLTEQFQAWPSVLVLDGLDEVTEPTVRKGLIGDITAFASEAETNDADLLLIVTTRPNGYMGDVPDSLFERVDLADLSIDDALTYGRMVTRIRVQDDESRRTGIEALLGEAAKQQALRHLMRTPLQVLIMTIIAETARQFAPDRFGLFWGYYRAILSREQTKKLGAANLLRDQSQQILDLHRHAGLLLQQRAETATGSDAVLSPKDLHDIAWQVLTDADYKPSTTDAGLLEAIVNAATHRLVLLAPQPGGGFGFDVRSLQELMAAMELTTGTLDEVIPRLRRIAASPHWRNTLLFSCGRYFSEPQPPQHQAITELVLTIDDNAPERLSAIVPVGPQIALEIVDDGMTSGMPKWLNQFTAHALTALHGPEPDDLNLFTRMLMRAATINDTVRGLIAVGLREALGGTYRARDCAANVQRAISHLGQDLGASHNVLGLAKVKRDASKALRTEPVADWEGFWNTINGYAGAVDDDALKTMATLLQKASSSGIRIGEEKGLQKYLSDPNISFIAEAAITHVAEATPLLVVSLRREVMPLLWRRPVH